MCVFVSGIICVHISNSTNLNNYRNWHIRRGISTPTPPPSLGCPTTRHLEEIGEEEKAGQYVLNKRDIRDRAVLKTIPRVAETLRFPKKKNRQLDTPHGGKSPRGGVGMGCCLVIFATRCNSGYFFLHRIPCLCAQFPRQMLSRF